MSLIRVALAMLAATSCASPAPSTADAANDAAAEAAIDAPTEAAADAPPPTLSAVYFVPPRTEASTYAVGAVEWVREGATVRLGYSLPRLLVGASNRVSFTGPYTPDGPLTLTGSSGTATCVRAPSAGVMLRCDERFVGLRVDLDEVRREAERTDPARVEARVSVATRFSIEPIGVLEVPSP